MFFPLIWLVEAQLKKHANPLQATTVTPAPQRSFPDVIAPTVDVLGMDEGPLPSGKGPGVGKQEH